MLIDKPRFPIKQILMHGWLPSPLKKIFYRLKGYSIGNNVSLGLGSVIIGTRVQIGEGTSIGFLTVIRATQITLGRYVKIGATTIIDTERVFIDDDAKINEQVFIGGPVDPESYIKIGKRTIIMQMSFLNPTKPLIIGDDTGIGGHCLLFTHGSWLSQLDGYPVTFAPITLGKNVWLPWRVFIMPGVSVGDNTVIGANSLVTKNLPPNSLAAGSPAKIISEQYPPQISKEKREEILLTIFDEFIKYLKYFGFELVQSQFQNGFKLHIKKNGNNHALYYLKEADNHFSADVSENVVVLNGVEEFPAPGSSAKAQMIVDLDRKTRSGSSEVGEEFLHYISRFGLRFERLD